MPKQTQSQMKLRFILGAVGVFFLLVLIGFHRHRSDAQLALQFKKNQSAFVELLAMVATNSQTGFETTAENVWPMEQYHRYRRLLRDTGVMRIFHEGETFHFQVAGAEKPGTGYRITITWTAGTPDHLISSLDHFHKAAPPLDHAYRPLGDGWYLCITR